MRPNDCTGNPAATVAAGGHLFIFNLYYGSADFGLAWLGLMVGGCGGCGGCGGYGWRASKFRLPTRQNSDEAQVIPAVL